MSGNAGEEHEDRGTEMRDPPGEKKGRVRMAEIGRIVQKAVPMEIIANMIDRHDDHYGTPEEIDGPDTGGYLFLRTVAVNRMRRGHGGFVEHGRKSKCARRIHGGGTKDWTVWFNLRSMRVGERLGLFYWWRIRWVSTPEEE